MEACTYIVILIFTDRFSKYSLSLSLSLSLTHTHTHTHKHTHTHTIFYNIPCCCHFHSQKEKGFGHLKSMTISAILPNSLRSEWTEIHIIFIRCNGINMYILVLLRFLHLNQQSCRSKLSFKYLIQYFTTAFWISVIVLFSFRRIPKLEKKSMMVLVCGVSLSKKHDIHV